LKKAGAFVFSLLAFAACSSSASNTGVATAVSPAAGRNWADSVLATLTLREKAAQMVWPTVLGDYTAGDSPQWQRLTDYIKREKVGGFTISVGSPTEVAAKLNALQQMI
jgi:beta-N-acetylhexosaminidase